MTKAKPTTKSAQRTSKRIEKLEKRVDDLEDIVRLAVIAMKAETPSKRK